MRTGLGKVWLALMLIAVGVLGLAQFAEGQGSAGTVLTVADTTKLLPPSVFFRGQSATVQVRNSGGVKFSDGMFVLAALVDTSGYSSDVQAKYQAYFINEVAIKVEGHELPAGIYGVGFIPDSKFIVLDVGAHDLFTVTSKNDGDLKRPTPLKVVAAKDGFRLYAGRNYVTFTR
jgi:hypothetical protein